MHEPEEPKDQNPLEDLGYEQRDLELTRVPRGAVMFFVAIVLTFMAAYVFMRIVAPGQVGSEAKAGRAKLEAERRLPQAPNPLLQGNVTAKMDMVRLRAIEDQKANTYGWVDQPKGVVHIPVDRAIDLLAQRGVPSRRDAKLPEGE